MEWKGSLLAQQQLCLQRGRSWPPGRPPGRTTFSTVHLSGTGAGGRADGRTKEGQTVRGTEAGDEGRKNEGRAEERRAEQSRGEREGLSTFVKKATEKRREEGNSKPTKLLLHLMHGSLPPSDPLPSSLVFLYFLRANYIIYAAVGKRFDRGEMERPSEREAEEALPS